jgi:hypothetical protein
MINLCGYECTRRMVGYSDKFITTGGYGYLTGLFFVVSTSNTARSCATGDLYPRGRGVCLHSYTVQRANGRKAHDTVPYFVRGDFIRDTKTCVSVSTWGMGMETNRIISGAREGVATLDPTNPAY